MYDSGYYLILLGGLGVTHLPLIVIAIVGIVLAGRRVADNPRAARLARAGCVVLLAAEAISVLQPFLALRSYGAGMSVVGGLAGLGLLNAVLIPIAVGLLVAAAVGRRRGGTTPPGGAVVPGYGGPGLVVEPTERPARPDFGTPDVLSSP